MRNQTSSTAFALIERMVLTGEHGYFLDLSISKTTYWFSVVGFITANTATTSKVLKLLLEGIFLICLVFISMLRDPRAFIDSNII